MNVGDRLDGDRCISNNETIKIYYSVDTNNVKSLEVILDKLSEKEETKDENINDFLE